MKILKYIALPMLLFNFNFAYGKTVTSTFKVGLIITAPQKLPLQPNSLQKSPFSIDISGTVKTINY